MLDGTDIKILRHLQENAQLTNVELARHVNLSASPCLARVKALKDAGYIKKHVALLNPDRLGLQLNVFIFITLKEQGETALKAFELAIADHEEIMECYLMTGESDYLIRVAMPDIASLEAFIVKQLSPIPQVAGIRSSFALKQVTYKTALPLGRIARKK